MAIGELRVRNWERFQHYKRRAPPWIKLHRTLLDDHQWHQLDGDASKMLAMCWLIASETDGNLPPIPTLAFRLRLPEKQIVSTLSRLTHWIERVGQDASAPLAPCKQDDLLETETETETDAHKVRAARAGNGTRLAEDWQPSPDDLLYATQHGLNGEQLATEIERFRNHWLGKAGKDGRKSDWPATWRNWVISPYRANKQTKADWRKAIV